MSLLATAGIANTVPAAGGAFSPADLFASGEEGAWYDPSDLSTMWTDTGGTSAASVNDQIARIDDKSGNGHHATQATLASRPFLRQSGALYYLEFDGTDDHLFTSTITPGTNKVQVFTGFTRQANTTATLVETSVNPDTNTGVFVVATLNSATSGGNTMFLRSKGSSSRDISHTGAAAIGTYVYSMLSDIAGPSAVARIDGVQVVTNSSTHGTGNYLAHPLHIGNRNSGALPFAGDIYNLIVRFGPNLSTTDRDNAESYVAGKTGVTL